MGYELRRWLADRLPADLSSGERLVALEIADQANETTRRAYGRTVTETIVRRTGYADDKQLGKVLGKLAAHGVELRVPVRDRDGSVVTDKRGRRLFACNGHAVEFRVPTADECPALKLPRPGGHDGGSRPDEVTFPPDEAAPNEGPSDAEGAPVGPEGAPVGPEAPPSGAPFSSVSSASPQKEENPPVVLAVGELQDRNARAAAKAPTAQPENPPSTRPTPPASFAARAVIAAIPRYRTAPPWARRHLASLADAALTAGFGRDAILRYAALVAAEQRFADHQHIPELREALRRLSRDVALGTACVTCAAAPGDCCCASPGGWTYMLSVRPFDQAGRAWTDDDAAALERALEALGATEELREACRAAAQTPTGTET